MLNLLQSDRVVGVVPYDNRDVVTMRTVIPRQQSSPDSPINVAGAARSFPSAASKLVQ